MHRCAFFFFLDSVHFPDANSAFKCSAGCRKAGGLKTSYGQVLFKSSGVMKLSCFVLAVVLAVT